MLLVTKDLVVLKEVLRWIWMMCSSKLEQTDGCVIDLLTFISLFEGWRNIRIFLVVRDLSLFQWCWENQSQYFYFFSWTDSIKRSLLFSYIVGSFYFWRIRFSRLFIGLSGSAISWRNLGNMSSRPVALYGFRFRSSFSILFGCTVISRASG